MSSIAGEESLKERLEQYFLDHEDQVRKFIADMTARLIAQPTVSFAPERGLEFPYMDGPGQEARVASLVAEECARTKLECKLYEKVPGRANVVASVGKGRKKLVVPCGIDVVPPGRGWKGDPFEAVITKQGTITGRGALDCKGPLVAALAAAHALKPLERQLKGQLIIVGHADSRHISGATEAPDCGLDYLLSEGIVKSDFAIVPALGRDLRHVNVAEKGRLLVRVRFTGKTAYGAVPERGDNAVMKMVRFLHKLSTLSLPYKPHDLMGRPTLNVGEIHGGHSASTVPAECEVSIDMRYLSGQTVEAILPELKKLAAEAGSGSEFIIEQDARPTMVDPDNILVRSIQENTSTILEHEAQISGSGFSTVCRELNNAGILAVGFGPGAESAYEGPNESVEIDQLVQFAQVIAGVVVDLFT